jgi:hypothetical protein
VESSNALGLVERAWIDGIVDSTGYVSPGCWDDDREFFDFVRDENGRLLPCYLSVDPAQGGDSFWSLETWQVDPKTRKRFLIAGRRGRFNIREVLNDDAEGFGGVLYELVLMSVTAGARPVAIVIEANAAKHFLQSRLFSMFKAFFLPEALLIPFQTTPANKNDAIIGVTALLQPAYRGGEVRLPRRGDWGYLKPKLDELTAVHPKHTDCTMAEWVGAASIDKILVHAARTRRGPSPVVRFGGRNRQAVPSAQPMITVYGERLNESRMPFQPIGADPYGSRLADVSIDQRSRNRVNETQAEPMSEVARIALGLPTRRSPDRRDGRPDGTVP